MSIYGEYEEYLGLVLDELMFRLNIYDKETCIRTGEHRFEHISGRIKSDQSMRDKLRRKGLPENEHSALKELTDSIGVRIVCSFREDIYDIIEFIREMNGCRIVEEKDYISRAKPNGYRSYHLIVEIEEPFTDCDGNEKGLYYAEVQLRTIAMDSWAALEHKMKYKKNIKNEQLIVSELKRCADELAACDVSMQTIRQLINESE